jgi:nicotinamidase-related amidase
MPKRCLIIIDMLNDFLDRCVTERVDRLVGNTNLLIESFRRFDLPVIWVRQEFRLDLSDAFLEMRDKGIAVAIEGTRGSMLHPGLDWRSTDLTLVKKRYSAFFRTPLDEALAKIDAGELVLCGVNTHACVRMAAIDAYQRDYRVVIARECVGSNNELHERVSLDYMDGKIAKVAGVADIIKSLGTS